MLPKFIWVPGVIFFGGMGSLIVIKKVFKLITRLLDQYTDSKINIVRNITKKKLIIGLKLMKEKLLLRTAKAKTGFRIVEYKLNNDDSD